MEAAAPTDEALRALLRKIIGRLMKLLTRRGVLVEEEGSTYLADGDGESDDARTLRPLQAAACTYRIAFGPRAGLQGVHGAKSHAARCCVSPRRCAPTCSVSACTLLVPRPRLHLIRFHGVLALYFRTSAKLRALVVPAEPGRGCLRVGARRR